MGEEATRGRDERGGVSLGGLGGYDSFREDTSKRRVIGDVRIGVDVNVEEVFVGLCEKGFPERSKREGRGGEEEEGDLGPGPEPGLGFDAGGDPEEDVVVLGGGEEVVGGVFVRVGGGNGMR